MPQSSDPPNLALTPLPQSVDLKSMDVSIRKIAAAVNKSARHTERIPEIHKKVEGTSAKVIELGVKLEGVGERVSKVENKVESGHDCYQEGALDEIKSNQRDSARRIELDALEGVAQKGKLDNLHKTTASVEADVESIKNAPRKMFMGLVGVILTVLSGILGGVWFLAELSKDVEFERRERTQQMGRIEKQIKKVGSTKVRVDTSEVEREIKVLEQTVRQAQGDESFITFCDDMNYNERRAIRRLLQIRGRTVPESCMR